MSGMMPFFLKSVVENAEKLEGIGTPKALELAKDMRTYEAEFASWQTTPPEEEQRSKTISAYLTMARQVMEYCVKPT